MEYTIVPMDELYYEELAAHMITEYNKRGENRSPQTAYDHISHNASDTDLCFAALCNEKVVWWILWTYLYLEEWREVFIDMMVVEEKHQQKWIGTSLITHVRDRAEDEWVQTIRVLSHNQWNSYGRYHTLSFRKSNREELIIDVSDFTPDRSGD